LPLKLTKLTFIIPSNRLNNKVPNRMVEKNLAAQKKNVFSRWLFYSLFFVSLKKTKQKTALPCPLNSV